MSSAECANTIYSKENLVVGGKSPGFANTTYIISGVLRKWGIETEAGLPSESETNILIP